MKRIAIAFILLISSGNGFAEEKVTLIVPNVQCEECTESISNILFLARATPDEFKLDSKRISFTFDPTQITIHQLMHAVFETPGLHGKPYVPYLLVEVKDLEKGMPRLKSIPKKIKGVARFVRVDPKKDELAVLLSPLNIKVDAKEYVTLAKLADSFHKAGVKFKGLGTSLEQKKGTAKKGQKPEETKKKQSAAQKKATKPRPRFQILAFANGKAYLVDNEASPKLKKFVQKGDAFGKFTVADLDEKDGKYIELKEKGESKRIRVER